MKPDLYWIRGPWQGSLAVVARPRGGDWLVDEAAGWRAAGLDVVVSLLEADEAASLDLERERFAAESNGIAFISFPIPDRSTPNSLPDALRLFEALVRLLERGKNVAVHCRQGVGRSGIVAAGTLVASGVQLDRALQLVGTARGVTIPETPGQLKWLEQLPAEMPLLTASAA